MAQNKAFAPDHKSPFYENAPLNELAIGVFFERLSGLQARHVGQFWTEVANDFPTTEDQPPILDVEGGHRFQVLDLPPLRRSFLVSEDQNFLIQVQESRFVFNWRKKKNTDVYPRFTQIFDRFLHYWGHFSDFVARERVGTLKPLRYELTYVNHIERGDAPLDKTAERYTRFFNYSGLNSKFLPPPSGINVVWTFPLPNDLGFAQANLSQGVRSDGRGVVVFVMSCNGSASPKVSMNDWFGTAHQWLGDGFKELTTDNARSEWGYRG